MIVVMLTSVVDIAEKKAAQRAVSVNVIYAMSERFVYGVMVMRS